jgi:UDP-3-O-[3-hydroxymyristoyl] glucosamine N-acyltransferase
MAAIRFYRPERGWSPSGSAAGSAANAVVHSGLMEIRHRDNTPSVDPGAYIAPTAVLSGQVRVGPGSCVLHGAVLSADGGPVDAGTSCVIIEQLCCGEPPSIRSRLEIMYWPARTAT